MCPRSCSFNVHFFLYRRNKFQLMVTFFRNRTMYLKSQAYIDGEWKDSKSGNTFKVTLINCRYQVQHASDLGTFGIFSFLQWTNKFIFYRFINNYLSSLITNDAGIYYPAVIGSHLIKTSYFGPSSLFILLKELVRPDQKAS